MRLIDADALMKLLTQKAYLVADYWNSRDKGMFLWGIEQAVNEQPTVDAEPIRHGRWILNKYNGVCNYHCSECLELCDSGYDYCPNCGAKMDK